MSYSRQLLFANNAQTTLAGSISNSALNANLAPGTGVFFPAPGTGQAFIGTFTDAATGLIREIVEVTAVVGDTITMVRAQEGTTAEAWAANDLFAELWTAGQAGSLLQVYQGQDQSYNYAVDTTGVANSYVIALTPAVSSAPPAGMPVRFTTSNTNTGASTLDAGWGPISILRRNGSAMIGGEISAASVTEVFWDGVHFLYDGLAPATAAAITAGTDGQSAVTPAQLSAATKPASGQCQLQYVSPTQIKLIPYNGNVVQVSGSPVQLPAAGSTAANTSVLINGVSGNLAASTVYLVALSAGPTLEFWTLGTGHSSDATAGNIGVEIITGHPTKSLVGMIATDSSGNFVDTDGARQVISWFNRRAKGSKTHFTGNPTVVAGGAVAEISSTIRNTFLVWGGDTPGFSVTGTVIPTGSGSWSRTSVGFNGATPEIEAVRNVGFGPTPPDTAASIAFSGRKESLTEGLNYVTLVACAVNFDFTYQGGSTVIDATNDPPCVLEITVAG